MKTPLGLKQNNPGNMRPSPERWDGQTGVAHGFCVFSEPVWGLRALAMQLIIYQQKHACRTVREIITRWAPGSENNTAAYIADVARRMGVTPDSFVDLVAAPVCAAAVRAIVWHENGQMPYDDALIAEAVHLAGTRAALDVG